MEPSNQASIRTLEYAAFDYEGVLLSYMPLGGRRRNMAIYARLRRDVDG